MWLIYKDTTAVQALKSPGAGASADHLCFEQNSTQAYRYYGSYMLDLDTYDKRLDTFQHPWSTLQRVRQ